MNELKKLREGEHLTVNEIWEAVDQLEEILSPAGLLDALAMAIGTDALESNLSYIVRCHDLGAGEE